MIDFGKFTKRAFTLIEMLVVVLLISILFGMVFGVRLDADRDAQVYGAAQELASVLRETRFAAMRANRTYAVTFNIENAPMSSGRILNNRSGGHWYRVVGPRDTMLGNATGNVGNITSVYQTWGAPPFFMPDVSYFNGGEVSSTSYSPLRYYLDVVDRSWSDEVHVLPRGKVRFLALTDQDNGDNNLPSLGGYYSASYPRPWFGWWGSTTVPLRVNRLFPWGGYDPDFKQMTQKTHLGGSTKTQEIKVNGRAISHTGFYYEGFDGPIENCLNKEDRKVLDDRAVDPLTRKSTGVGKGGSGVIDSPFDFTVATQQYYTVLRKDEPRPLVNGRWLDFCVVFYPDGRVVTDWFRLRNAYARKLRAMVSGPGRPDPALVNWPPFLDAAGPTSTMAEQITQAGYAALAASLADRTGGYGSGFRNTANGTSSWPVASPAQREATDYVDRTGFYWITLAPDAPDDNDVYPSAAAALKTMMPMYRVGVSPSGLVKVIKVRTTMRDGRTLSDIDDEISGLNWEVPNKIWGKVGITTYDFKTPITKANYMNHLLWNADGSPRGVPIDDVVVPEMLANRAWWWK